MIATHLLLRPEGEENGLLVLPALAINKDLNRKAASRIHSPKKKEAHL